MIKNTEIYSSPMINENKQRLYCIDILKGICSIFVIITHYNWQETERLKFLFPFWIDMAVPVFMIISGYLYAKSYKKKEISNIGSAYLLENILNKIFRFTFPFTIIFLIEQILFYILTVENWNNKNIWSFIYLFLRGGTGPGSYYYPVMIQFIFVFPVIYFIIKKHDFKGLLLCGILNALFEILKCAYCMSEECYGWLMFRYLFVIAFGCYMEIRKTKLKNIWYFTSLIIGVLFIIIVCYTEYTPVIVIFWTRTSFISGLYIIPIMVILINKINFRCKILELFGKASFNIFLVQMVYFNFIEWIPYQINSRLGQILINIIVCVSLGSIFYYIEGNLGRKLFKNYK